MVLINADLHLHSRFSGGTSADMDASHLASWGEKKGLDLVGTGDCTHPVYRRMLKEELKEENEGIYRHAQSGSRLIYTTEVEDAHRVHHVILLPSADAADEFSEQLAKHADLSIDGRPHVKLEAAEVVDAVESVGGLIGPSHAFTPWTSIYKEHGSLLDCYGTAKRHISFVELGLSSDTDLADRIEELTHFSFLTASDSHSPQPHRLGREFTQFEVKEVSFPELAKAFKREGGRKITLNAGLNPREGKYHLTACTRCYKKYRLPDAATLKYRCPICKGLIKKGVLDRINELASWDTPHHPQWRPPYKHILPLHEAIALAKGIRNAASKKVGDEWVRLTGKLGSEINVLLYVPLDDIRVLSPDVASVIQRLRNDSLQYVAGGGGQYGRPTLTGERDDFYGLGQKSLLEYNETI
ncbi:Uncharacterised protein [uncultured archaeon]|nr:Uncharacterised protein [uncultured archaeon]